MKSRLPLALALTGLLGASVLMTGLVAAPSADAQQSPAMMKTEHPTEEFKPTAADRAAFLDARIAALKAGLALTPDQAKLWPPVETVLRDMAKAREARIQQWEERKKSEEHKPIDPIARLVHKSERLIARGEALKKLADAAAPLYAALSDEQKHRLPILLRAIHPHFGHHHHFGWNEGEHEHGGWHHHWHHEGEMDDGNR